MIILFGLAGSGKGTQGKALSEIFGWRLLSAGQVIRDTGAFDEIINSGHLISDDDIIKLMDEQITKTEAEGFDIILDGYPRSKPQAEYIVSHMADSINGAIILEVPKPELIERLTLRGRADDTEIAAVEKRFEIFDNNMSEILPILSAKNIPVAHVDGVGTVEEVTARLVKIVENFTPNAVEQAQDVNGAEIEQSYGE